MKFNLSNILKGKYENRILTKILTVETTSTRKPNSLEGDIGEYGQKNISTIKRNLMNKDEILRVPSSKLLAVIRGNEPLLLDKIIYKKHPLASRLKDSSVLDYNPKWSKKVIEKSTLKKEKPKEEVEKTKIDVGYILTEKMFLII